jgi:hypothetical protein
MTPDVLNPDVLPLPAHAHHNDLQLLFVQATAAAATQLKKNISHASAHQCAAYRLVAPAPTERAMLTRWATATSSGSQRV